MIRAVHPDKVAMVGENLQYGASLGPRTWGLASLILYGDLVTQEKRGKLFSPLLELLMFQEVPLGKCSSSLFSSESPFRARGELARLELEEISQDPPVHYLSW